jgi:hypothetical protein
MRIFSKLLLASALLPLFCIAQDNVQEQSLLPELYKVYYIPNVGVINHPVEGAIEKILPTVNLFKGEPGCYVACYSHQENQSIYPVAEDIFVMGQVRVEGHYDKRICQPKGYESKDISAESTFKQLCENHLKQQCAQLSCWAGGDTGGWFGVQP